MIRQMFGIGLSCRLNNVMVEHCISIHRWRFDMGCFLSIDYPKEKIVWISKHGCLYIPEKLRQELRLKLLKLNLPMFLVTDLYTGCIKMLLNLL